MTFHLTIETDGAAFDPPGPELATILRRLAENLDNYGHTVGAGTVRDANGNTVGAWQLTEPEPECTIRQTACRHCGFDIEGDTADEDSEWTDRGGNTECTYVGRDADTGAAIPAPAGLAHEPTDDDR